MVSSVSRLSSVFFTREAGDWCAGGGSLEERTCQKLVSSELHVFAGLGGRDSQLVGRDESSENLTCDLMHSWRSRGDNMRLE